MGKKLCNIVGIVFQMIREGIAKKKIRLEVHMLRKTAGMAITKLFLRRRYHRNYYSALTCRTTDAISSSFVAPRDYEFSCSDTPTYTFRRRRRPRHQAEQLNIIHRVLDHQDAVEASPLALPGFGCSPIVRQLRVSDSPYSMRDEEEEQQVDEDAEKFIKKFYKDLKNQRRIAGSPSPYWLWA